MLIKIENIIAPIIINTVGTLVNSNIDKQTINSNSVSGLIIDDLKNLINEGTINAQTPQARPFKRLCTIGYEYILFIKAAIIHINRIEGEITPRVDTIPPIAPLSLCPTNVATFTAITPGVI